MLWFHLFGWIWLKGGSTCVGETGHDWLSTRSWLEEIWLCNFLLQFLVDCQVCLIYRWFSSKSIILSWTGLREAPPTSTALKYLILKWQQQHLHIFHFSNTVDYFLYILKTNDRSYDAETRHDKLPNKSRFNEYSDLWKGRQMKNALREPTSIPCWCLKWCKVFLSWSLNWWRKIMKIRKFVIVIVINYVCCSDFKRNTTTIKILLWNIQG